MEYGISMVRERAALHGIDDHPRGRPERSTTIDSDELRFKQVLLNLLSNAVKFTPDGGHVAVAARRVDDDLVVTVTDDGIGIPPEDRSGSSSRSSRAGAAPSSEEGTGLGLTLCRRIVALLGGTMWLEIGAGGGQHLRLHRADRRSPPRRTRPCPSTRRTCRSWWSSTTTVPRST